MAWRLPAKRERPQSYEVAAAMQLVNAFRVDVAQERDAVRVCPVGEVDIATVGELRARMDEALAASSSCVILDLRETTFLDSSALHLAVDVDAQAAQNGIEFAMIAGSPRVQRTFEIAGLSARLPFVDVPHG